MTKLFPTQNKTEPALLSFIERNAYCTTLDAVRILGLKQRTVEQAISRLLERGLIHVADYDSAMRGSGRAPRQFLAGPGRNAKAPKPSLQAARRRKNEWQRDRRARLSLASRAGNGPFGSLIAQIY